MESARAGPGRAGSSARASPSRIAGRGSPSRPRATRSWTTPPLPSASGVTALREMEAMVLGSRRARRSRAPLRVLLWPRHALRPRRVTRRQDVRRRRLPIVGKGSGVFSFIHVDDAADATVAAVERGAPGIYNISDDEPRRNARVGARVLAEAAGAKPRCACRSGWRGWWAGKDGRQLRVELRGARTRRRSASSAGGPRIRAGAGGSRSRWRPSSRCCTPAAGRSWPRRSAGCPRSPGSST